MPRKLPNEALTHPTEPQSASGKPLSEIQIAILRVLARAKGGKGIASALRSFTDKKVSYGNIYFQLQRLEMRGLIISRWRESDDSRDSRMKEYEITGAGAAAVNESLRMHESIVVAHKALIAEMGA